MRKLHVIALLAGLFSGVPATGQFDLVALADAEGDGLVSKDEFTAYYALIWSFFVGGKSTVDVEHAQPLVRATILGVLPEAKGTVTRDQMLDAVPTRYGDADTNKDGIVTLDEMREWRTTAMTAPPG
jgi:hypothetical protein